MSLVTLVCGSACSDTVLRLAKELGYATRPADDPQPIDLEATPDLILMVQNREGVERVVELDQRGVRYWLLFVGAIPREWDAAVPRRPHAWVAALDHSNGEYLHRLLDDWKERAVPRVDCFHFSYREGVPAGADWVVDTRCLDSPHWVKELRSQEGGDADVAAYVTGQPAARILLDHFESMIVQLMPHYVAQRRTVLRVGVGCTGGKHRSQAITDALVGRINRSGVATARRLLHEPVTLPREAVAYLRPPGAAPTMEVEGSLVPTRRSKPERPRLTVGASAQAQR